MFFWKRKSDEETAADRLLDTSPDEIQALREEIEERNDRLSIQIVSNQKKIQALIEKGKQAPKTKQQIIAEKCSQLERRVKKAQRELRENLNQLTTVGVAELLVEGRKTQEFADSFKDIIGAENPSEFKDAVEEIQVRQDLNREERERLTEIGDLYDQQYEAAGESDPDKFMAKMRGLDEEEEIDVFEEPEPISEDELLDKSPDDEGSQDHEFA